MKMDLNAIGNINSYVKNWGLQTKFEQKKRAGVLGSHDSSIGSQMREELKKKEENEKLGRIGQKMMAGKKLTVEEQDYLRSKNPQAYQEYLQSQEEQKSFEESLRRCKTKEDVQRLKTDRINAALSVVKSVENNAHISTEAALGVAMGALAKVQAYERITQEFIESGEYGKLPTDAEKAEAEKAGREELMPSEPEKTEENAKPEETEGVEKPDAADAEKADTPETERPAVKVKVHTAPKRPMEKPAVDTDSPEARKVRRAKAKAAYIAASKPDIPEKAMPALNIKG